ncbi:MAG TPA: hypothetical protein VMC05_04685 [Xanthobacteraceae bacterium]|nr:hypothetical protein [Xanthobacteraceae bacterium]
MVELEFYDPSGTLEITQRPAPRLDTLKGKRIAMLSNEQWQAHRTLPLLKSLIETDFPGIEVLPSDAFPQGEHAVGADSTIAQVKASGVDAVIIGNAACGSCSTALARAAAKLESVEIPTVLLGRTDFLGVVRNAVSGMGMPPELPVVAFPVETFLPGSDLAGVEARRQEFYDGLTVWRSTTNAAPGNGTPLITASGASYGEALTNANNLLLTNLWSDGLPIWPATEALVRWILQGTDRPRETVLGKVMPRGGIATIESCAIALAMAGGRPEYLPVLIAAVEAFLDPLSDSEHMQADSAGAFPVIIVNGPIAGQVRLNTSFGCLGPDPQRPAGASIGRALRLMQQNLGGAVPGVGAMAMWGAMRFTNAVFGEDESSLPDGWLPHATERHGFAPGTNSVSMLWATGVTNIRRRGVKAESPEVDALRGMRRMAAYLRSPNLGCLIGYNHGTPGVLMLSPVVAKAMATIGWTKQSIREFLWEHAKIPAEELRRDGIDTWIDADRDPLVRESLNLPHWPHSARPENLVLLVAGGGHPTNSYWMEGYTPHVVGRKIELPSNFAALLEQASRDIGCGAETCRI